jgi:hypothetical protein
MVRILSGWVEKTGDQAYWFDGRRIQGESRQSLGDSLTQKPVLDYDAAIFF